MNYKLAIFDLDGTILYTLEDLNLSLNHALKVNHLPERTLAETRAFVGNGIRKLMERAVPKGSSEALINKVHEDFTSHYKVHSADHTKPYAGILDLLADLKKAGIYTAVVSNKADYAVQDLCKQYFDGYFDSVAGEKTGIARKPAPDSVNFVLNQLGVDRTQAVYIGDSEVDVQTALNADMDMIIVNWGFRDEPELITAGATRIVSKPEAVFDLIIAEN